MTGIILVLVVSFFALLLLNAPVCAAIALASFAAIFAQGLDASFMVAQRMANGVDSFPLLAIPFFVFAGYLMGRGGLARRLIDFLSGVAYAGEGKIKKVAANTYIITPYSVDIMGDLIDELENNGLYL